MTWIDRLEKLGRLVLWLSLASVCVLVPLGIAAQHSKEEALERAEREATKQLAALKAEPPPKPERLTLKSMGMYLGALRKDHAEGQVWFTNVSPRTGVLCIRGVAKNATTGASSESLAACQEVTPYASAVHVSLMFAGGDLTAACQSGPCQLSAVDVADAEP